MASYSDHQQCPNSVEGFPSAHEQDRAEVPQSSHPAEQPSPFIVSLGIITLARSTVSPWCRASVVHRGLGLINVPSLLLHPTLPILTFLFFWHFLGPPRKQTPSRLSHLASGAALPQTAAIPTCLQNECCGLVMHLLIHFLTSCTHSSIDCVL